MRVSAPLAGLVMLLGLLTGCAAPAPPPAPAAPQPLFVPLSFNDLPGWTRDRVLEAKPALVRSCEVILRKLPDSPLGADGMAGTAADWQPFCRDLMVQPEGDEAGFRSLLDNYLAPFEITDAGKAGGLFTGYYEPVLHGARTRGGIFQTPLYKRPPELVMVDLGLFRDEWKGQRTAGFVDGGRLKPFADRKEIVNGALAGRKLELVWLDSPIDAFFVQVQGSGRVQLPNGREIRIGYDGQNGQPYTALGRALVARGAMDKADVNMDSIRAWLQTHPDEAETLMNTNRSYVFFHEAPAEDGPTGAAGVPLTPLRSLAVDNRFVAYGVPVWLDAEDPRGGRLSRLMVAQDTGGAITGVVRGDVFWGHGPEAERAAGMMKSAGRMFVLLPKTVYVPTQTPAQ